MLPKGELARREKTLAILLTPGMLGMWLLSAALIYLVTGATALMALLIGAIVTPTDPILARTISEGDLARKNIPTRIRYTLLGESGINDGLAYPFVFLAISLIAHKDLITFWGIQTVLWAVVGGSVFGFALGYVAGVLLRWSQKLQMIEEKYYLAFTLSCFSRNFLHLPSFPGRRRHLPVGLALSAFLHFFIRSLLYAKRQIPPSGNWQSSLLLPRCWSTVLQHLL